MRENNWKRMAAILVLILPRMVHAQLALLPDKTSHAVFSGTNKTVSVKLHNPTDQSVSVNFRAQLYQTSSATAIALGEPVPWKKVELLAGQTVFESTQLTFPTVKASSRFLVKWLDDTNKIVGSTEVMVYPTNLLQSLATLAGKEPLGIYDPQNQLKPLLKIPELEVEDLAEGELKGFAGKLAIIGPFAKGKTPETLSRQIQLLAKKGKAVVWIQSPPEKGDKLQPSFYSVPEGTNAVVVVQPELTANLADNPQSQLNLIYFCQLALNPRPLTLPVLSVQPDFEK